MKKKSFLIICLNLILLFSACEDQPAGVGSSMVYDDDMIQSHTLGSDDIQFTQEIIETQLATSSAYSILVGKHKTEEAIALLRFVDFPDSLGKATVISADIMLYRTNYYIGDPSTFGFSIFKITSAWDADNLTSLSVSGLSQDGNKYGSFKGSIDDTGMIYIPLSTSLVKEWLEIKDKDALGNAGNNFIQGLMLVPEVSSGCVYAFYSKNSEAILISDDGETPAPRLRVITELDGERDTIFVFSTTTSYYGFSRNFNKDDNNIVMQSGVAYRTKLTFDISKLPEHIHVSNATLTLTLDASNSNIGINSVDSLTAYTKVINPISYTIYDNYSTLSAGYISTGGKKTFDINMTLFLQAWLERKNNNGMEIAHLGELVTLDKLSFYSNSALNPNDRPKLKVEYLTLPK
jgi:hypothetical protein